MTDKTPEIKNCPFCGGPAALEVPAGTTSPLVFTIGCLDEGCIGFPAIMFQTRKAAVEAWNRRAP